MRNGIDHTGNPTKHKNYDSYQNQQFNPFFDLGAWHGFLLPDEKDPSAAFSGPMIIAQEYSLFIAKQFEQLTLDDKSTGNKFNFSEAKISRNFLPGGLDQTFIFKQLRGNVSLKLSLRYISNRTAVITTKITNNSNKNLSLTLHWQGNLLAAWDDKQSVSEALPQWTRKLRHLY